MAGHRLERTAEDIKRELTAIFRDLKDPRIPALLSVVRVQLSGDMSYATVYVSSMNGLDAAKSAVSVLHKSAGGYIRRELGNRIRLRKMPELRWVADDSIEHGAHIAAILRDNPPAPESEDSEEPDDEN